LQRSRRLLYEPRLRMGWVDFDTLAHGAVMMPGLCAEKYPPRCSI
jgi:hypothetical protein